MTPIAGGRFCDHCAKVVHDFTDAKQAEFQKILIENSNSVCGRFRPEQMAPQDTLLPLWKRWLSAATVLLSFGLLQPAEAQTGRKAISQKIQTAQPAKAANSIFTMGAVMEPSAQFPGGTDRLNAFIYKYLRQPADCIEGKVFVQFKIRRDGSLSDFKILRGLRKDCDEEALRVAMLLPKWKPGQQNGKPVETFWVLPIRFEQIK